MSGPKLDVVILGLSITSSWGNGHATTYRALVRELARRGHRVLFLERDVSWYAAQRDLPSPPYGRTELYKSREDLDRRFRGAVRSADAVIVGSYVPEGVEVGEWVLQQANGLTAFYDIDTPVTLAKLGREDHEYLHPRLIPRFDLYLSFTGGPTLERLETRWHARRALPLYCSVDCELYCPLGEEICWDLGYLGTYSDDRQPRVEDFLLEPARRWSDGRFVVAGPGYPAATDWPPNTERIEHLPPELHCRFYNRQRFTLNVTRDPMRVAGWSPSVRLFEAAACGVPIISDTWPGLSSFLEPGREIFLVETTRDALRILRELPEEERAAVGRRARERVLAEHSAAARAEALERYLLEELGRMEGRSVGSALEARA